MTQYNSLNAKLSDSQLNKFKSAVKNKTKAVLRLSSNMISNSDNETKLQIDKLQIFVKLLQIIHQLILSYQKLNYVRSYNQENFLVDFLVHY